MRARTRPQERETHTPCRQGRFLAEAFSRQSVERSARVLHTTPSACKETLGDREQQDMPAAGIATSGPGTGSSNIGDAGTFFKSILATVSQATVCTPSEVSMLQCDL